eukprot:TRINITY_DN3158_c0_g7_i1.p1 TRINITY_DN3158_c0_g7~~TRINITY_DN3158_c0_g7_i1.p1  ORF type:complete len:133 (+),score=38.69 TRINITY_DN3158_c0_g7_i1:51-449(+)
MASEITPVESKQPHLCLKCQQFYGSPQTNGYCSVCYKEMIAMNPDFFTVSNIKENNEVENKKIVDNPIDLSHCAVCGKKVGYFGFKCHCGRAFCSVHRYPDEHSCTYDFQADNEKKLADQNIRVATNRLNKL